MTAADPGPGSGSDVGSLFRSVDVAVFAAALVQKLRGAGVEVGPTAANRLALALDCCPPTDVTTLYWLTRTSLLHDRRDFATFDRVFDAVFGGIGLPIAPWERQSGRATVKTEGSLLRQSSPTDGFAAMEARINRTTPEIVDDNTEPVDDEDSIVPELLPAALADLVDTPFDQLSLDQLTIIGRWLEQAVTDLPRRRTRRLRPAGTGQIDLRRTLRHARATGEIIELARHRPAVRPRPLVMLADVSGSMESYTRIYLHLMRALVAGGAGTRPGTTVRADVEVFTFATDLRRVTVQLRDRDPQAAIDRLTEDISDRFSGTRIAGSLGLLLASPRWSHSVRGATVLIASDGWDSEPVADLSARMARLQRMSHRVIWINPRSAGPDFQPVVAGMAGALPYVDRFLSGHSLRAVLDVIRSLADQPELGTAARR